MAQGKITPAQRAGREAVSMPDSAGPLLGLHDKPYYLDKHTFQCPTRRGPY
jgi:hypothetical protein